MLSCFEVKGFKNFKDAFVLDLSLNKNYEFHKELLKDGIVRAGVVFGKNSSGKSNLGLAIFDIVNHLTDDKEKTLDEVEPFINLNSTHKCAEFKYTFSFDKHIVKYEYGKTSKECLFYERLLIDDKEYVFFDYIEMKGYSLLKGTEQLNTNIQTNRMSFLKYVMNNSIIEDNFEKDMLDKLFYFVNNMLLFYSLNKNNYFGFRKGVESLSNGIVKRGKLKDFESFWNKIDIPCHLISKEVDGEYIIYNQFENGEVKFFETASTGTKALTLFYYWLVSSEKASFIFMDEFDAYYHYELARIVVEYVLKERKNTQIFFTTHNTNLMTNELFRPDCLYLIQNSQIKSINGLTEKELRYAHNLQKMYKAGAFDEE